MEIRVLARPAWPASSQGNKNHGTFMNSWEVGALWDKPGCGRRTEKPVTRGIGLQVTHCSTQRGILHTCYEVKDADLGLCRTQPGPSLEEGNWIKGT